MAIVMRGGMKTLGAALDTAGKNDQITPNGIKLNTVNNVVRSMAVDIGCISGVGPSNLVVPLTPHGEPL
eukprot:8488475-Pyramimonas_sp.AAC.1